MEQKTGLSLEVFSYNSGKLTLTSSNFTKNSSLYAFAGTVTQASTFQVQGKLTVSQRNIQDILATLQVFEVQDLQRKTKEPVYGNAAFTLNQLTVENQKIRYLLVLAGTYILTTGYNLTFKQASKSLRCYPSLGLRTTLRVATA